MCSEHSPCNIALLAFSCLTAFSLSACSSQSNEPLSTKIIVVNSVPMPDNGQWNDLLGRPLIQVEYASRTGRGKGPTTYLYDARTGECRTVIHPPEAPGAPILITWAPCK
jgi:hypothetical protein